MIQAVTLKALKPFATLASGMGREKKLFILIYHRVLDEPDFMRPGEVDKAAFLWQMEMISTYFNVLPLHDAMQKIQNHTLPPRAVSITFDDGYADNFSNALPILKRFGLTATFFIASGFLDGGRMWNDTVIEAIRNCPASELDLTPLALGRFDIADSQKKCQAAAQIIPQLKYMPSAMRDEHANFIAAKSRDLPNDLMMTGNQVQKLHQSGMEIGGHTVTHPILAKLKKQDVIREVAENKEFLENLLGTPLRLFAYPNGKPEKDYLPEQKQIVRDAGYQAAVSTEWGVFCYTSDRWQLPRFTPWDPTPQKFMLRMILKYIHD